MTSARFRSVPLQGIVRGKQQAHLAANEARASDQLGPFIVPAKCYLQVNAGGQHGALELELE